MFFRGTIRNLVPIHNNRQNYSICFNLIKTELIRFYAAPAVHEIPINR